MLQIKGTTFGCFSTCVASMEVGATPANTQGRARTMAVRAPAFCRRRGFALPTMIFVVAQLVILAIAASYYSTLPAAAVLGWSLILSRSSAAVILFTFPIMVSPGNCTSREAVAWFHALAPSKSVPRCNHTEALTLRRIRPFSVVMLPRVCSVSALRGFASAVAAKCHASCCSRGVWQAVCLQWPRRCLPCSNP